MNKIKKASKPDIEKIDKAKRKKAISRAKKARVDVHIKSGRIKGGKKTKIKPIKVKHKQTRKYTKYASKSQIEKHIVNGQFVFSKKMQKQYNELNKRFGLTPLEYLNLYYGTRKANAKGRRLAKEDSLYHIRFSLKMPRIRTRADYERRMMTLNFVLDREYKQKVNERYKAQFMHNINIILSDRAAQAINDLVKGMSASELKEFIEQNPDLEKIMYESDNERFTMFDKEAASMIETRLRTFLGLPEIDVLTKYDIAETQDLIR